VQAAQAQPPSPPRDATSGPVNPYQVSAPQNPVSVTPPPYSGAPRSGVVQPPIKPVEPPRYYNPALTRPSAAQPAQPSSANAQMPVQPAYPTDNRFSAPNYDYGIPPAAEPLQPLTLIIGGLALLAVLGVIVLWLMVWSAYS
jgi:hypothetical protein